MAELGQPMTLIRLEQRSLNTNNPVTELAGMLMGVVEVIHRSSPQATATLGWIVTTAGLIGTTAVITPILTTDSITDANATGKSILKALDGSAVRTTISAAAASNTHTIANITALQTAIDSKLTTNQGTTVPDSTATDAAEFNTSLNALLTSLRSVGIIS